MKSGKIIALLAASMAVACELSPAKPGLSESGRASAGNSTKVATNQPKSLEMSAAELTKGEGALVFLKALGGAKSAVLVVRYASAGTSSNSFCSLNIVEGISGRPTVVASSKKLLSCSHASNLEGVKESISADVKGPEAITVSEQLAKNSSEFTIERHQSGDWFVTGLKFNHPRNNLETGYVEVVSEAATYPLNAKQLRVAEYEYDKVRRDLVETLVE